MQTKTSEPLTYSIVVDFQRCAGTHTDLKTAVEAGLAAFVEGVRAVVLFNDHTGNYTELNPNSAAQTPCIWLDDAAPKRVGPGRPKLGVVSREISLLPRHWDWLQRQPGSASAILRRLIDETRKVHHNREEAARGRDAAGSFMSLVGGDRPHFEAATRALYAGDFAGVVALTREWPADLAAHVEHLIDEAARRQALAEEEKASDRP